MMKNILRYTIALILAGISLPACQQILTDANRDEIASELRDQADEILESLNEGDTATFFTYFSDQFTLISGGEKKVTDPESRTQWMAAAGAYIAGTEETAYSIEDLWIEVYAHTSANACYDWVSTTTFENDSSHHVRAATTCSMILEKGMWKIKHAHISGIKD